LKPIEKNSLLRAIEKFRVIHYNKSINNEVIKQLLNKLNKGYKNRFLIKVGEHYKSVSDKEITCFYILERATFLRTSEDNDYAIDYSLDNLQKTIDPDRFFRINRNCIININQINDIIHYSSSRLKIELNTHKSMYDLIVSKDKVREFKKWIDK
jgi:DNA-binding LytR/AlgR family response regulator